jgi:uncharacterized membrane protein (UPF0127 family)
MQIHVNEIEVPVEIADDDESRSMGLMKRSTLNPGCGMLFIFPDEDERSFWMKDTYIPLSIAFLSGDGTILNIEDMKPFDQSRVLSSGPARCALEMNQGWFRRNGVRPGDKVTGIPIKPMAESTRITRADLRRLIKEALIS